MNMESSQRPQYHRFPNGETCSIEGCRERRYYEEDGRRYCKRHGHAQEGYVRVEADEDDWNKQGRTSRKKKEFTPKVLKAYVGRAALELYCQCWQFALWKQVAWLVEVKGFPQELEVVVRDLWAVRLRAVKGLGEDDAVGDWASQRSEKESSVSGWETEGGSGYESTGSRLQAERRERKWERQTNFPKVIETLGMCYLGMLLMRLPVSLGEIQGWVEREEILYLRVIREIPKEMRSHLPAKYQVALEMRSPLRRGDLYKAVKDMVIKFRKESGITFPPVNAPIIIFNHVRNLCLPLNIYAATRRLTRLLTLNFRFPSTLALHGLLVYPEIQIMAMMVIATKLSQPFDDVRRIPEDITDPGALRIDWSKWQGAIAEQQPDGYRKGDEINVTESEVFKMTGEKLDSYLDWYQRTWIDDRDLKMAQEILDMFPLDDGISDQNALVNEDILDGRVKSVQSSLLVKKAVSAENGDLYATINRHGEFYRHYRTVDDLPDKALAFYEKAAEQAGVSLDMLVRAVFLMECKLQSWIVNEKRRRVTEDYAMEEPMDDERYTGE